MTAEIIYTTQFKDEVLAKMDHNEILIRDLAAKFPDHHSMDIREALQVLKRFGAVDCKRANRFGAKVWWRV